MPAPYSAVPSPDSIAPPLRLLLGEAQAVFGRALAYRIGQRVAAGRRRGEGRTVMVVPGFLAHDGFTRGMRRALAGAGYAPHGWGLGVNRGASPDLLDRLVDRFDAIVAVSGAPVSLIGWSLGGIYVRELAKLRPDQIDRVITLGSPFSGDPRANRAWKLYERVSGHPVDAPPLAVDRRAKPPVRTFALWSPRDGIVAPASARGEHHEADDRIEVACRHFGFLSSTDSVRAIFDALEA